MTDVAEVLVEFERELGKELNDVCRFHRQETGEQGAGLPERLLRKLKLHTDALRAQLQPSEAPEPDPADAEARLCALIDERVEARLAELAAQPTSRWRRRRSAEEIAA